jgi:tetratricopeptide (TPR) repeat protein
VTHEPCQGTREFAADPNLDRYEEFARRHLDMAGPMGYRHMSYTFLGHAAFLWGDWNEALRLTEEATRHSPFAHDNSTGGMDWAGYLLTLAYCGNRAQVLAVLEDKRDDLPRPGQPNGWGPWHIPLASIEALWLVGERDRAADLYPLVREFMATTGVVLTIFHPRLVERVAGIAAAAGQQWDVAESHFHSALRQAEELPFVLEQAETRRFYAQMLLERNRPGDREKGRRFLEEAIVTYRRIGMPRHEELARGLQAQAR